MTISSGTARKMRRVAMGAAAAVASGVVFATGAAHADEVLGDTTTTIDEAPATTEAPPTTEMPPTTQIPVDDGNVVLPPIDVDDCPGCGMG